MLYIPNGSLDIADGLPCVLTIDILRVPNTKSKLSILLFRAAVVVTYIVVVNDSLQLDSWLMNAMMIVPIDLTYVIT